MPCAGPSRSGTERPASSGSRAARRPFPPEEGLDAFIRDTLDPVVQEVSGGRAPRMERPTTFEVYFEGP